MIKLNKIPDDRLVELKKFAKLLTVEGVRNNTELEDLHAGISPSSNVGDFTDVKVISPDGEIEWNQLSRISDVEMRSLMLSIEKALENALIFYESLGSADNTTALEFSILRRSYDCIDFEK